MQCCSLFIVATDDILHVDNGLIPTVGMSQVRSGLKGSYTGQLCEGNSGLNTGPCAECNHLKTVFIPYSVQFGWMSQR